LLNAKVARLTFSKQSLVAAYEFELIKSVKSNANILIFFML
jgi:hypothetical protein